MDAILIVIKLLAMPVYGGRVRREMTGMTWGKGMKNYTEV